MERGSRAKLRAFLASLLVALVTFSTACFNNNLPRRWESEDAAADSDTDGDTDTEIVTDSAEENNTDNDTGDTGDTSGTDEKTDTESDVDTATDTDTGTVSETDTEEADSETDVETDTESEVDTETETDTGEADSETDVETDTESEVDTETETDTGETDSETDVETDTEPEVDTETEAETESQPDSETDTDSGTETGSDTEDTDSESDSDGVVIGENWVRIPPGTFWMGSPDGDCPAGYPGGSGTNCEYEMGRMTNTGREDLHLVTLTGAFEMGRHEVTQGEFEDAMGWNPSTLWCSYGCGDTNPVYYINWYDAVAYANKYSADNGLTPCYVIENVDCKVGGAPTDSSDYLACFDGSEATSEGIDTADVSLNGVETPYECEGYRLPTEAEWEYAIRAGSWTPFYPSEGNDGSFTVLGCNPHDPNLDQIAWFYCNSKTGPSRKTHPVGELEPNDWGLHDMSGNVWEWVWDGFEPFTKKPVQDPTGLQSSDYKVYRGGFWYYSAMYCRSAFRTWDNAKSLGYDYSYGFRLARSVP